MRGKTKKLNWGMIFMVVLLMMLTGISPAEEVAVGDYFQQEAPHKIHLIAGKSQVIQFKEDIVRSSVSNPEIASLVLVNPQEILVNAKAPGVTTIIAWNGQGQRAIFDVVVDIDTSRLASLIQKVIAGEEEISVNATNDKIVLSGEVEKSTSITKAGNIAEAYLPEVVNLLRVKETKQILLQVRFAEAVRDAAKEMGIQLLVQTPHMAAHSYVGKSVLPGNLPGNPSTEYNLYPGPPPKFGTDLPAATDFFLELWKQDSYTLAPIIRAFEERGLLRTIAEPNLLALEGQEASFVAGGEIPIATVSNQGTNIEWREYGVRLTFKPTTTDTGAIQLELEPEVSSLDTTNAVGGVPALRTRKAHTIVELEDGESLIIGGLMQQETTKTSTKTPFLGDIPILGKLFSSEAFERGETELLVMVTPILIESRDIKAAKRPRLTEDLPPALEAKGATYRDGRGERFKDFLDGKKVQAVIPEAEIKDEESLFERQPVSEYFKEFREQRQFLGEEAGESEAAFSEREVNIYKQLPPKYNLMRKYYYGGI